MSSSCHFLSVILAATPMLIWAQTPAAVRIRPVINPDALARPAVPADPLEMVTDAQSVQDAQQRLGAIGLLERARGLSNVRAQPYDLKTSFISWGGLASDGSWTLEDISAAHMYRWTAQGPNYSATNLYPNGTQNMMYSSQPGGFVPLRLAQVREAIFFNYQFPGPQASVRTASGSLNGAPQSCVLVVIGAGERTFSGGRNWEETEYCVDTSSGLLTTYSPTPGLFVHYDYSSAVMFHGKTIPGSFTITEGGRNMVEARTISVTDPPGAQDPMFNPAGLTPMGVGRVMTPATRIRSFEGVSSQTAANQNATLQIVVLHGNLSPDGHLGETEILASTDPSLNQAALERANRIMAGPGQRQPGATPQSREVFFTLEFMKQGQ